MKLTLGIRFLFILLAATCCAAEVRNVPADYPTIQAAIDDANDGDTVLVAPGIYTGDGNRDIDFMGKAIMVRSIDPNDPIIVSETIIDCQGNEDEYHRGFKVYSNSSSNTVLDGITVVNGYFIGFENGDGGGILCSDAGIIRNCIVTNNTAFYGGGISITSNGIVTNCIITNNCAMYNGGGVNVTNSGILRSSKIVNNIALNGGGARISDNSIVKNCIIYNNQANSDDPALGHGGGIFASDGGHPVIINCTIVGNYANRQGGGVLCGYRGETTMSNCILVSNQATWGSQISTSLPKIIPTMILITMNCCIQSDADPPFLTENTIFSKDNIDEDPLFVKPYYWANANDPNIILEPDDPNAVFVDGDYHLKSQAGRWEPNSRSWVVDDVTSPCIDAGDPNTPVGDEPEPNGGRINMGAYGGTAEASKSYLSEP